MEFRKSSELDLDNIMDIIRQAQFYFKSRGIDQWQDNYPNIETINADIKNGNSYVLLKGNIVGTAALCFGGEKNYECIYEGKWMSDFKYAVIHRIAVAANYKGLGLASVIIKNIEKICRDNSVLSIRADTHRDNVSMQKMLQKNKFEYCGIIYLNDGSERIAFEKII